MINFIFNTTVSILEHIRKYFRITYEEINVIIWYYIIPLTWLLIINTNLAIIYSALCLGIVLGCESFRMYSLNLFFKSEKFLFYFKKYKMSYELSSIIFCLIIPTIIYLILLINI